MIASSAPSRHLEPAHATQPGTPSALSEFFQRIAQIDSDFIVYDDGWRGWTYRYSDVAQMAGALTAQFRSIGIGKGDHVLIWSESRAGWIAALWACLLEGVILVPVEFHATLALLRRIEQQIRPRLVLLGDLVTYIEDTTQFPVRFLRDVETDRAQPPEKRPALYRDDVAEIIYTSGSTAEPKGVIMTHRNLAAALQPLEAQLAPYRKYLNLIHPFRVLNLLPMSHLFGQAVTLFVLPLIPGTAVFLDSTSPEEIAAQIRRRKICAIVSVPQILEVLRKYVLHRFPETANAANEMGAWPQRWWRYRTVHRFFGCRFCCLYVGGAALSPEVEQFWLALGFVVAQGYGLTETAPIISFNHPFHAEKNTVGKPIAGLQLRLGPDGEVLVRGDNVTPGYFQLPGETAAAFENGWLHTGDIGELTAKGDLIIRGRKKDLIVTPSGLKIHPSDVEHILNGIAGVRESAVIDNNGVYAVLILEPGAQGEAVIHQANQQLEAYQRIRSFSIWPQAGLPRTSSTQKLRRNDIAAAIRTGGTITAKPALSIIDLVQKYAPGRKVTTDTTLDELGLSSLDRVELILDLEEKLNITIDDSAFSSVSKVSDLAQPLTLAEPIPEPTYNRTWIAKLARRILLPSIFLPLTRVIARPAISGRHHLRGIEGPIIFAANHQSYIDASVILASLPSDWRYHIAPAMWMEYFDPHFHPERFPFSTRLGTTILYCLLTFLFNAFPLSQAETGTRQTLRYIGELTEEKWSILIFPEGERTMTGDIGHFYPGIAMIASRMQVPIIPIRLIGLDKVLHRGSAKLHPGRVDVRFGAPITLKGQAYSDLAKQVENAVRSL
ncbi:AMP-binding protein [Edaphobacter paludis]|uniref:AMP-binding protein n=1 Tax=Edaphobacter paludis TaxID=3035702 RepID=A0AAU7CZZ4_9BACT